MTKTMKGIVAGALLGMTTLTSGVVLAHRTGNERRTIPQCMTLTDAARQVACVRCVSRARPHHYHPLQSEGWRCDRNDGTR